MTIAPLRVAGPGDDIDRIYDAQQSRRAAIAATAARERIEKLKRFERAMLDRRDEIREAMWQDFRKPVAEVDLSEIYPVVSEARHAIRHLRSWMKPKRVGTRLSLFGSRSRIVYEPKGVVLVVAPWNFPFNLTLSPLVSAIAAGNCVMVKPSELSPASAACMKRILGDLFEENEVAVFEGDVSVSEALLRKKFDHIFFTGSPAIGRLVMKAAAEHLTSVTLELGGKSPVIVDKSANLADAARKIAWGKFYNAGQVCIAPDYVLVDERVETELVDGIRSSIESFGENARGVIVNERHAARVRRLLDSAVEKGARIVFGGTRKGRELEPTVLTKVALDAAVMQEEIFGPVLPIVPYRSLDEALSWIDERERPLVMYIFSGDRKIAQHIVKRTRAGGTAINQTMIQFYELELPFGGVGQSGMGKSHGRYGFEAFSNARGVLEQRLPFSPIDMLYPPYVGKLQKKVIDFTLRWL